RNSIFACGLHVSGFGPLFIDFSDTPGLSTVAPPPLSALLPFLDVASRAGTQFYHATSRPSRAGPRPTLPPPASSPSCQPLRAARCGSPPLDFHQYTSADGAVTS